MSIAASWQSLREGAATPRFGESLAGSAIVGAGQQREGRVCYPGPPRPSPGAVVLSPVGVVSTPGRVRVTAGWFAITPPPCGVCRTCRTPAGAGRRATSCLPVIGLAVFGLATEPVTHTLRRCQDRPSRRFDNSRLMAARNASLRQLLSLATHARYWLGTAARGWPLCLPNSMCHRFTFGASSAC